MNEHRLLLGGYVTAPRAARQDWQDAEILPEQLITVSECLTGGDHGPEFLAWHTGRVGDGPLLAVGFHPDDVIEFIAEVTADFAGANGGELPDGERPECLELLASGTPMPAEARLRGFEVIGVEYALSSLHSWLCHGYEGDVAEALDIRPNDCGLHDTHQQAIAVLDWIEALPADRAPEPVYWTVAAVADLAS
ncbi:MAG: hypothetical protein GEU98_08505 [Pseudonocardiaceae bacterium]|nr:hypothetical protein [Pseudonocardiaceae bacterium]